MQKSAGNPPAGGPIRLRRLLKLVGAVSPLQLSADQLIREDVIARAGLTPTDLLHVTGEYCPWDGAIARQAVAAAAAQWAVSPDIFIQRDCEVHHAQDHGRNCPVPQRSPPARKGFWF